MPLYEYACHRCGKRFEVRQKFSDEPLKQHEECGGEVERLLSTPSFQFKGSGWYVTDYAKQGAGKAPGNGAPESKGDGKTETKTESKSESKGDSPAPSKTPPSKTES